MEGDAGASQLNRTTGGQERSDPGNVVGGQERSDPGNVVGGQETEALDRLHHNNIVQLHG